MASIVDPDPDRKTTPERCNFWFAPGVRCQMAAGHAEPYYPYLDRGQWGEYSNILSLGTPHQVQAAALALPPRDEWTGNERRDALRSYPIFRDDFTALGGDA